MPPRQPLRLMLAGGMLARHFDSAGVPLAPTGHEPGSTHAAHARWRDAGMRWQSASHFVFGGVEQARGFPPVNWRSQWRTVI